MGTKIRPSVSEKNENHISKERYYELVHFCKQYQEWQEELNKISLLPKGYFDPTGEIAVKEVFYLDRIQMIENTANKSDLGKYILEGVTTGKTYEEVRALMSIPCCRNEYYRLYRQFFKDLSEVRK